MRVLFICPPTSQEERYGKLKDIGTLHPSLGIAYIAAYTEKKGHTVNIIDSEANCYNFDDIKRNIKIILGGTQATLSPKEIIKQKNIDFIICGEGEITFTPLLDALECKKNLKEVNGLIWKDKDKVIINKSQELIKDISILPFPARHLLPMEKYHSSANLSGKHTLNIMTSRGCPFRCAYCSGHLTFGKTHRYNSTENVIGEIKELIIRYKA